VRQKTRMNRPGEERRGGEGREDEVEGVEEISGWMDGMNHRNSDEATKCSSSFRPFIARVWSFARPASCV